MVGTIVSPLLGPDTTKTWWEEELDVLVMDWGMVLMLGEEKGEVGTMLNELDDWWTKDGILFITGVNMVVLCASISLYKDKNVHQT